MIQLKKNYQIDWISDDPFGQTGNTNRSIRIQLILNGSLDIQIDWISERTSTIRFYNF